MNELMNQDQQSGTVAMHEQGGRVGALAAGASGMSVGAVAIEQERAIAEARGQMQLARMFPRNMTAVYAELMEICKLKSMAEVAFYTIPQGTQKVTGASIKLMEQIASVCEHIEWGHRELSRIPAGPGPRDFGRSEIEVYAWDKQKNTFSKRQIVVEHSLDTKEGPRKLRDQRDIDNKIANVASKQMRGRLGAILPKFLIEAATEACKQTLAGTNDKSVAERVRTMTQVFAKYGVTVPILERYLGHTLDSVTSDELADLTGVFNGLKDGIKPSEIFGEEPAEPATVADTKPIGTKGALASEAAPAPAPTARPASTRRTATPKPMEEQQPPVVESTPQSPPDDTPGDPEDAF